MVGWTLARGAALALALGLAAARPAAANPPITDGDYRIELYEGGALGNAASVAMGGTGVASQVGTAGALTNASAPAVRRTTDRDRWGWDYHLDYLDGGLSSDHDNNGAKVASSGGAQRITGGLMGRRGDWALAVTSSAQTAPIVGASPALDAEALRVRLGVARWLPWWDVAVGLGAQTVSFRVRPPGQDPLFTMSGTGLVAGATWVPRGQDLRLGAGLESRILGADVTSACAPGACGGYILPAEVASPARLTLGAAYRRAPTRWNRPVPGKFRDERALTVAADLLVTGHSPRAYGLEAFGAGELQRSGKHVAISPRAGAELEWLPGRLRARAGSYWEPGRFEGVGGRLHATFGVEVRVGEVRVWGPRRGRITLTGDVARDYRNLGVSIGLWQ